MDIENTDLLKLAESIRDGKASKEDKLKFFQMLNLELGEISEILNKAKKNKKNE